MSLSQELDTAKNELETLRDATQDPDQKREVAEKLNDVLDEMSRLAAKTIDDRTGKYLAATEAITDANNAIRAAQTDLAKVAETITKVAAAVALVQKVAKAAT